MDKGLVSCFLTDGVVVTSETECFYHLSALCAAYAPCTPLGLAIDFFKV